MLEQPTYPWKLQPEDLPNASRQPVGHSVTPKMLPMKAIALSFTGFAVGVLWLIIQYMALEPSYAPHLSQKDLPRLSDGKLVVVPSPVRYGLSGQKDATELSDSALSLSKGEMGIIPASYTPSVLPPELTMPAPPPVMLSVPPPPPDTTFSLIGVAQGSDGTVATLKIMGEQESIKDIRLGETLEGGYVVQQITDEAVILKQKKQGKTIRVD